MEKRALDDDGLDVEPENESRGEKRALDDEDPNAGPEKTMKVDAIDDGTRSTLQATKGKWSDEVEEDWQQDPLVDVVRRCAGPTESVRRCAGLQGPRVEEFRNIRAHLCWRFGYT